MIISKLTKQERETHLWFNEADDLWEIQTDIKVHMTRCQKLGYECTDVLRYSDGTIESMTFKAPKHAISFRSPIKRRRELSDEQRKEIAERLKASRSGNTDTSK